MIAASVFCFISNPNWLIMDVSPVSALPLDCNITISNDERISWGRWTYSSGGSRIGSSLLGFLCVFLNLLSLGGGCLGLDTTKEIYEILD